MASARPKDQIPTNRFAFGLRMWIGNLKVLLETLRENKGALVGAAVTAAIVVAAILAPFISPASPETMELRARLTPPSWKGKFALGSDHLGRDVLTRIIYGARVSILVGLVSVGVSILFGGVLGMIAGYYGGVFDAILSRLTEVLLAFPYLIFTIAAMAFLGPGFWNLVFALCFKGWVEFFRLARAGVLTEKTKEYVEAARVLGRPDRQIMTSEILPNIVNPILVVGTLRIGTMIVMEASLSFLGIGIPSRIPTWGSMIQDGYRVILNAWWLSTFPGLMLLFLVLSINLLGEGLREALDPDLQTY